MLAMVQLGKVYSAAFLARTSYNPFNADVISQGYLR